MGLKIDFPDRTGGICKDAYVIITLTIDNRLKEGCIELEVWKTREYRLDRKEKINHVGIQVSEVEEWEEEKETVSSIVTKTNIKKVAHNDFAWKLGSNIYTKLKSLKVNVNSVIVDLSKAQDVFESGQ